MTTWISVAAVVILAVVAVAGEAESRQMPPGSGPEVTWELSFCPSPAADIWSLGLGHEAHKS